MTSSRVLCCFAISALAACSGGTLTDETFDRLSAIAGLPDPEPDPANKYVGNGLAIDLGHKLFFDTRMSGVASQVDSIGRPTDAVRVPKGAALEISCVTCHDPARGGADYTSSPGHVSVGAGWYDVNSISVTNSAYYDLKYWNGRYDSLVWQATAVIESGFSMNFTRLGVAWLINDHYRAAYEAVFTDHPLPVFDARLPRAGKPGQSAYDDLTEADRAAIDRIYVNVAKALAAYEYTLIGRNSAFDRWVADGRDSDILSDEAIRGARLFVGKASCIECHGNPLMSDEQFYNIGVPQVGATVPREVDCPEGGAKCDCVTPKNCLPWGFFTGLGKLKANTRLRIDSVEFSDDPTDTSRKAFYDLEPTDAHKGAWRTPTLRDVAITAPYMHNGYYATLEEVVQHYNRGGTAQGAAPSSLSVRIAPLGLSDDEVRDLVAFLDALTSEALPAERVRTPDLPGI